MPSVHEIEQALFAWAPKELAGDWDNVGHLVGSPAGEVKRVLVALDITDKVVAEAKRIGADLIVAHHPVLNIRWHSSELNSMLDNTRLGGLLATLIKNDISAICMHTNLDAAQGGVNDVLAGKLGLMDLSPLSEKSGIGRVGTLPHEMSREALLALVKEKLTPNGIRYCAGADRLIRRVAVGGGSCGDMFFQAMEQGCDAFVTADVRYEQFMEADRLGLCLIDAGHYPTEDVICPVLVDYLAERFPALTIVKSSSHREVIEYYL